MAIDLTYRQEGDYLVPNLELDEQPDRPLNRYGRMRLTYLKEHRPILYSELAMSLKLHEHLLEIQDAAQARLEDLMPKLMKEAGATEKLKTENMMKWVGLMNNCKAQAEEIVFNELIYC